MPLESRALAFEKYWSEMWYFFSVKWTIPTFEVVNAFKTFVIILVVGIC